ncbi:hypothetical protein [Streptococcus sp. zg-JUN1979]
MPYKFLVLMTMLSANTPFFIFAEQLGNVATVSVMNEQEEELTEVV